MDPEQSDSNTQDPTAQPPSDSAAKPVTASRLKLLTRAQILAQPPDISLAAGIAERTALDAALGNLTVGNAAAEALRSIYAADGLAALVRKMSATDRMIAGITQPMLGISEMGRDYARGFGLAEGILTAGMAELGRPAAREFGLIDRMAESLTPILSNVTILTPRWQPPALWGLKLSPFAEAEFWELLDESIAQSRDDIRTLGGDPESAGELDYWPIPYLREQAEKMRQAQALMGDMDPRAKAVLLQLLRRELAPEPGRRGPKTNTGYDAAAEWRLMGYSQDQAWERYAADYLTDTERKAGEDVLASLRDSFHRQVRRRLQQARGH